MKVLIVCSGNWGKISPFVKEQTDSIKKYGIEIDFFLIIGKGPWGYLRNYKSLRNYIKTHNFDIIHAHYGLSGLLCNLQRLVTVVTTFHGSDINILKNNILSTITSIFTEWRIFVTDKLYKKILIKPENNFSIISCGIDFKKFFPINKIEARKKLNLSLSKKYIVFPSSFNNPVKNFQLAKQVIEKVEGCVLLELKNRTREEVNLLLNACDLLLLTSFSEGSPQIIKEAMVCNVPIVSTDVGDVKKIISGTKNCYITSYEVKDISNKIKLSLANGKKTNGRNNIRHLRSEVIARQVIIIYHSLLEKKKLNQ